MAKRRTAAQKRATRKMIAANRARARSRRAPAKSTRRRRRNPTPVARKRRAYNAAINISNPIRRRRRPRRRNPMGTRIVSELLQPSLVGAGGALLVDLVMGYVPLPEALAGNKWARAGVKGLAAVGVALAADATKLVSRRTAQQLGVGSLTVTLAGLGRELVAQVAPDVKLDGLGYYSSAVPAGVPRPLDSLGVYVGGAARRQLPSASREVGMRAPSGGLGAYDEMSEGGYHY